MIVECGSCRSLFNRSDYREEENRLRDDGAYLDHFFERSSSYYSDLLRTIARIRPDLREHLDVGCGVGALVSAGVRRGLRSQGLDLNPFAVERAGLRGLAARCEPLTVNRSAKHYDLVTCDQVLEHVSDPRQFLSALGSHVAPNGVVFLNVPYRPPPLLTRWYLHFPNAWGSPFFDNDVHINHFSRRAMTTVVKDLLGMRSAVPFFGAANTLARALRHCYARALQSPRGFIYLDRNLQS